MGAYDEIQVENGQVGHTYTPVIVRGIASLVAVAQE
jgi:hypothetical protein